MRIPAVCFGPRFAPVPTKPWRTRPALSVLIEVGNMQKFLLVALLVLGTLHPTPSFAGCSHGCGGGFVAAGRFGVVRPAFFGPVGRFPKLGFRAPIRRSLGLPGFTPVRQFLFGRGFFRRQNRRAFLFGRRFC